MSESFPHSAEPPRRPGVFYPTGFVVVAFPNAGDAEAARDALRGGGYADADPTVVPGEEVARGAEKEIAGAGVLPRIFGGEVELVERHMELARRGHAFLIARAASDAETDRVMAVVRRHPYGLAQKYDRLTVTDL